jgi:hypothetical protein
VFGATALIERLELGRDVLAVTFPDGITVRSVGTAAPSLTLHATAFDVLRLRLGRRTPAEVSALDWSADPTPLFSRLFAFGPAATTIGE